MQLSNADMYSTSPPGLQCAFIVSSSEIEGRDWRRVIREMEGKRQREKRQEEESHRRDGGEETDGKIQRGRDGGEKTEGKRQRGENKK